MRFLVLLRVGTILQAVLSVGVLIALAYDLGERGLEADANHTGGYTSNAEIVIGLLGFGSLVMSLVGLVVLLPAVLKSFLVVAEPVAAGGAVEG